MRTIRAQLEGVDSCLPDASAPSGEELPIGPDFEADTARVRLIEGGAATLTFSAFWEADTLSGLQAAQGASGRADPDSLVIEELDEDERVAFLAALLE